MVRGVKGNCTKLQRYNGTGWDTISKRISMTGPGLSRETVEEELVIDCDVSGGNPFKKKSPGTKEIGDITVEILWNPTVPTGTHQVETATGAGTVTVAGNAAVTITAAGVTGSPLALNIPVATGLPTVWVPQIVTYLQTNAAAAALRDKYAVTGSGANIVLTSHEPQADDGTLNIAIATGTATGITAAPTSADTTAGVAGEENDEFHHLFEDDFEDEVATFWRIVHPNDAGTGVLVHATVKEVGEPSYEANQNVKRSMVLEPTGEYYRAGNAIESEVLPGTIEAPQEHYGHH
jgi:hypothetical protein